MFWRGQPKRSFLQHHCFFTSDHSAGIAALQSKRMVDVVVTVRVVTVVEEEEEVVVEDQVVVVDVAVSVGRHQGGGPPSGHPMFMYTQHHRFFSKDQPWCHIA